MNGRAGAERREFRRLTMPLSARFRLRNSRVVRRGTIENISDAGAAILTPVPIPQNSILEQLRFSLDPQRLNGKVSVVAGVVSSEKQPFSDSSERYRSGLVFLDLHGKGFEKVREILERELAESRRHPPGSEVETVIDSARS